MWPVRTSNNCVSLARRLQIAGGPVLIVEAWYPFENMSISAAVVVGRSVIASRQMKMVAGLTRANKLEVVKCYLTETRRQEMDVGPKCVAIHLLQPSGNSFKANI